MQNQAPFQAQNHVSGDIFFNNNSLTIIRN